MLRLIVTANKLNKRKAIPASFPDPGSITGVAVKGYTFEADEVLSVPNPALGKWYKDRDNSFYWGGGLTILNDTADTEPAENTSATEDITITPQIKKKIEQVINVFETGSTAGNYAALVKYPDYTDPATKTKMVQVTYGRSQTTEFGNLKALINDYISENGMYVNVLKAYADRVGKKPSLATDDAFCSILKEAGRTDPIMKSCQDNLFDARYYMPAYTWFSVNGFTLPLSMLVIYDSYIHSGSVLSFLRKKFNTSVPASGGAEKDWTTAYVNARYDWLSGNASQLLRNTAYRPQCFNDQIQKNNWDLSQPVNAHGVLIT